jgi:AcrR family transcriptional regulator
LDKRQPSPAAGKAIKQKRSRKTYDALVAAGFKLLEHREFDSISVAALAHGAGYSVGAFYTRFRSKDEFFEALIAHHIAYRTEARERLVRTLSDDDLIRGLIEDLVAYYWKRRWFWRAALIRSIRDPKPLLEHADGLAIALIGRIRERRKRALTKEQERNVRYAVQITLGAINNAVIYGHGPVFTGQEEFAANLVRAFRLISDYDELAR